jgi:hypothetical protein
VGKVIPHGAVDHRLQRALIGEGHREQELTAERCGYAVSDRLGGLRT